MTLPPNIEWRAADLLCPNCGTSSMSVAQSVAACRQCGRKFDAEVLSTYEERYDHLLAVAEREPCPLCGGRRRSVRSLCDREARECFFLLACTDCGDARLA